MTSCHPEGKAGWAQPDLRPDGDLTHGAGAVKLGGTRSLARGRNRISPWRLTRSGTRARVRIAGLMAAEKLTERLSAVPERSGGAAIPWISDRCARDHRISGKAAPRLPGSIDTKSLKAVRVGRLLLLGSRPIDRSSKQPLAADRSADDAASAVLSQEVSLRTQTSRR